MERELIWLVRDLAHWAKIRQEYIVPGSEEVWRELKGNMDLR